MFGAEDLGKPKAEVAALRAKAMNVFPDAAVSGYTFDVVHELGGGFFRRMDMVLGCLDNVEARQAVGEWCYQFSIPYIDGVNTRTTNRSSDSKRRSCAKHLNAAACRRLKESRF